MFCPEPFFEAKPISSPPINGGWGLPMAPSEPYKPVWCDDEAKKIAFGARLGKGDKPLDAALLVLDNKLSDGLWAVANWIRDPLVVETRENVESNVKLLDKDQFSAKLLKFAEEKTPSGNNFAHEAKDRLAALKLYAEVQGFVGKVNIDASQKTFNNNSMVITLVEADQEKETKTIEHKQTEVEPLENALNVSLKLVG